MAKRYTTWLALTVASSLLAACVFPLTPVPQGDATGATPAATELAGTSWLLSSLNGQPAPADPAITLSFGTGGQVSGSDGCNRYSGQATIDGTTLTFGTLATTRRACPAPIMEQANAYQTALSQTASYTVTVDQLTLLDTGGQSLAEFAAQPTDLAGTSWTVIAYNNGQGGIVSTLSGTTLTAEFSAEGQLGGSAGCNQYNASYETDGSGTLTIGAAISTRMACTEPEGVLEQEAQFLEALATVATYRMEGNQLELRTADGEIAVQLHQGVTN
jgi:heat shock protein HslJ